MKKALLFAIPCLFLWAGVFFAVNHAARARLIVAAVGELPNIPGCPLHESCVKALQEEQMVSAPLFPAVYSGGIAGAGAAVLMGAVFLFIAGMRRKLAASFLLILLSVFGCVNDSGNDVKDLIDVTAHKAYTIVIDISDNESDDAVTVSPAAGEKGDNVTLSYTVANTKHYNLLDFSGVTSAIDSVNSAGSGTRTYTINAADASSDVITITAVFTHTDLPPAPIAFNETGHISKTYGDVFTNAIAAGYKGTGAITYSSSDTTIAAVNNSGQVTIHKVGNVIITAEKAADAVYAHAQTSYTLSVDPKSVTITGLTAENKQYDGKTKATVTGTAVISGLVGSDVVTVVAGTAAFADKNVGTGKAVTFSGYSLSGVNAGNYSLTQPTATANITAKPVTITGLSAVDKVYDGTSTATVNGSMGQINESIYNDDVTIISGTAEFEDAEVGNNKTVTFSGWLLGGKDAGNYTLSAQPASVTANITAATPPSIIDVVLITGGTFTMGSPSTEAGRSSDETQRSITLGNFYIGKYQVTQEQYQAVMGTNPSNFKSAVTNETGTPGKLPVENVTWFDAVEFCNKLSENEGLEKVYTFTSRTPATGYPITNLAGLAADFNKNGYRLPSEAQWEYACRAGTTEAYNNENNSYTNAASVGAVAWYTSNSGNKTHQVGLKDPNAWGLYDMHGNVFEWCRDWYGSYSSVITTDPPGPNTGTDRVMRGGGWDDRAQDVRSALRYSERPNTRNNNTGFRVVRP
jgi:formylglycine-generating enzyme required for sulfatase activity